jgi:hypothetical protein
MVTKEEQDKDDILHKAALGYIDNLDLVNNIIHQEILLIGTSYPYLELYVFVENDILDYYKIRLLS